MDEKAQTSIEYILLIAGALIITVIIIAITKGFLVSPSYSSIDQSSDMYYNFTNCSALNSSEAAINQCLIG